METLSDRVKKRRSELNLTQAGLAELSGTKQQTIQQVESGLTNAHASSLSWRLPFSASHAGFFLESKEIKPMPPNRRPFNQHQRKYHKWRVQRHATKWRLAG
ncbi:helix-turn-helix domain-containing protein [Raoultella ornithinolytica]|uniref:helix-turn-helix domain-containing protein n=1 Tax=Raoultella ornithinolytica TaxID=54291 RepID=UPI003969BC8F